MTDTAFLNAAADGAAANLEAAWFAIHAGGSQVSNERLQPNYGAAAGGVADLVAALSFTGTGSAAATHLGVWTLQSAGTERFEVALTGDLAFNAAGQLDLTSAAITAT